MILRAMETKKSGNEDPKSDVAVRDLLAAAIARLEKLRDQRSDYPSTYELLGAAYELSGQNEKAVGAYAIYVQRSTKPGIALATDIRDVQARAMLLKHAAPTSNMKGIHDVERLLQTADKLENYGCFDEANERYLDIIRAYPGNLQARFRLGVLFEAKGEKERAIEHFRVVANSRFAPEQLILDACERIERLSLPPLSKTHVHDLGRAKACLEIANDLLKPAYLPPDEFDVKDQSSKYLRLRAEVSRLAGTATNILARLLRDEPLDVRLHAYQGKAALLILETNMTTPELRTRAFEAARSLELYLSFYRSLGLPETSKSVGLQRRREEALFRFDGQAAASGRNPFYDVVKLANGNVTMTDCLWQHSPVVAGRRASMFRVELAARKSYVVELESMGFKGSLDVRAPSEGDKEKQKAVVGIQQASSADAKPVARIVTPIHHGAIVEIVVASQEDTPNGFFVLRVREEKGQVADPLNVVPKCEVYQVEVKSPVGFQVDGQLGSSDPNNKMPNHAVYAITMIAQKTYTIELASKEFAPFLVLEDSKGSRLAQDGDPGRSAKIVFQAPQGGTFNIVVASNQANATGAYSLRVTEK